MTDKYTLIYDTFTNVQYMISSICNIKMNKLHV